MSEVAYLAILVAAATAALGIGRVMATRIEHAQRLAELISETRRLRARHKASAPPPRPGRR